MKNILIIGANSFIAKNTVEKLKSQDYNCILTSRTSENNVLSLDLEDEKKIIDFCSKNQNLSIDGILFFQGISPSKNTKEMTAEHFTKMLTLNLIGPTLFLKHFYKNLNKNSLLLFISSVAAQKGSYDPSYASAKSAITGLTQSMANEFSDLRFNTISLGLVENSPVYNNMTPDFREKHKQKMNNQFIQVDDVSFAILEILQNPSINRVTINIDGRLKNNE